MNGYSTSCRSLPVAHLTAYGFRPETIECWVNDGIENLMPLQARAVMETGLLRGNSVLALAPTSAGKTFVGELAAARHWQSGRKAVFLSPTRALAAEQYRHLRGRYSALGIRTVLSTADHTRHDDAIRRGDFDFAVMVYEKMRAFLVSAPDLIFSVGVVVADELQIVGDAERGESADLLLTRLTRAEPNVQVVGLSAVAENADSLAAWLDADVVSTSTRPTELREGVYCLQHGLFHYRSHGSDDWADEKLTGDDAIPVSSGGEEPYRAVMDVCVALVLAGESCLLFVPTRSLSRRLATELALQLGRAERPSAEEDWDELRQAEDSLVRRQFLDCMPSEVAFHNSDLTAELRSLVERAFNKGTIRVLVATPTLAQGVNLRAGNVIQTPVMMRGGEGGGMNRPTQVPLEVGRYRNQAGRAGRLGSGTPFGRSILVASSHIEAERLSRAFIDATPEPVTRIFTDHCMDHFVLECAHSGLANTYSSIHGALKHTFAWHCGAVTEGGDLEERLSESVRGLLDLQLLDEAAGHRLRLTGSGQAMAAGGFRAHTIREMLAWCGAWTSRVPREFEILCACALTDDGERFNLSPTPAEIRGNVWVKSARRLISENSGPLGEDLLRAIQPPGGLSKAGHTSLKLAVVAAAWISDRPTADIEQELRIVGGTAAAVAAHLAWLAGGLASCAAALECSEDVGSAIRRIAARLPQGLAPGTWRLAQLHVPGLSRDFLNRLAAEGFESPSDLCDATPDVFANILPRFLTERLAAWTNESQDDSKSSERNRIPSKETESLKSTESSSYVLASDSGSIREDAVSGSFDLKLDPSEPGLVVFFGQELRLPPKSYALLTLLAERCGSTVTYLSIDSIVWPNEKVEPQQISAHKSKLIRELGNAAGKEKAESAILTDARYGLRLNLRPDKVRIAAAAAGYALSDAAIEQKAPAADIPAGTRQHRASIHLNGY